MINIRESFFGRVLMAFTAISILFQVIFPATAFAITGGPTTPEAQGYSPSGTSDMVNLVNGDMSYNLSLFSVGDYPLNISYAPNTNSEYATSVVGNWNPSWGNVSVNMRGLPDMAKGDAVKKGFYKKKNWTIGVNLNADVELFAQPVAEWAKKAKKVIEAANGSLGVSLGIKYNNHYGVDIIKSISPSISTNEANANGLTGGLNISTSSQDGLTIEPNVSLSMRGSADKKEDREFGLSIGLPFNSRAGLQSVSISPSLKKTSLDTKHQEKTGKTRHVGAPGISTAANYSFSAASYTPSYENSMSNFNISFGFKFGGSLFTVFGNLSTGGNYSQQYYPKDKRESTLKAYGYMYAHEGIKSGDEKALFDFNREKDAAVSKHTQNIALAQETADLYSVTAPGFSGSFKTKRSDYGTVSDPFSKSSGGGGGLSGIDLGWGNIQDAGLNVKVNTSYNESYRWDQGNMAKNVMKYKGSSSNDAFEPYYFKQAGESTVLPDENLFDKLGGTKPVAFSLTSGYGYASSVASTTLGSNTINSNTIAKREKRNSSFFGITANDAQYIGIDKKIKYHKTASGGTKTLVEENRINGVRKGHHLSEIRVTAGDGKQYIYGLPAYVKKHKEVTYQTTHEDVLLEDGETDVNGLSKTGTVAYNASHDKIKNGVKDQYYQSSELPPYAHSYMLTNILSPDYVDRHGDGLTKDDHGNGTTVKYMKIHDKYGWRTPFEGVNFNEGFKTLHNDDKASYFYGTKEIYLVESIQNRTSIAIFSYEDSEAGYGALQEGGIDTSKPMKKLKKISLYSLPEYEANGASATPIKVAHFTYDYSLCKPKDGKLPNNSGNNDKSGFTNQGGKLTLKSVYFTYGHSKKGKVSPYIFKYGNNYNYNTKANDGWGNYMPDNGFSSYIDKEASNSELPSTKQAPETDNYASAWAMNEIVTPSGGTIKFEYESDDYAYVQDKRAMRMIHPTNIALKKESNPDPHNGGVDDLSLYGLKEHNYVFFKLPNPIKKTDKLKDSEPERSKIIKNKFFRDDNGKIMDYLYFKFLTKLNGASMSSLIGPSWEYVPGYAVLDDDFGLSDNHISVIKGEEYYNYAFFKVKEVKKNAVDNTSPFAKTAWNFTRQNLPFIAYDKSPNLGASGAGSVALQQVLSQLKSSLQDVLTMFTGIYTLMAGKSLSKNIKPRKSVFRLHVDNYAKKGGGHRVKKVSLNDNWQSISESTNYNNAEYGQIYEYTKIHPKTKEIISSGVAQNEPGLLRSENPMVVPDFVKDIENLMAPNTKFYQEAPFGEFAMPGASIVYSDVKVRNLQYQDLANDNFTVTANATGYVHTKHYTAKDFPVLFDRTSLQIEKFGPNFLKSILGFSANSLQASQGFSIETNNMHGLLKSNKVYNENDKLISSVEYKYQTIEQSGKAISLDSRVQTIDTEGNIKDQIIGMEMDLVTDSRYSRSFSTAPGLSFSQNSAIFGLIPIAGIGFNPAYSQTKNQFNSISTTKIIKRTGILKETIATDLGSVVKTSNDLYDAETGQILLTKTQNQFDDDIYNWTYPVHWAYDQLGQASKNIGYTVTNGTVSSLKESRFVSGDELLIDRTKYWVIESDINGVKIQDKNGTAFTGSFTNLKIIRSGRRNMQGTPMGTITSMENPVIGTGTNRFFALKNHNDSKSTKYLSSILSASATEFSNDWTTFCNCEYKDYDDWNLFENGRLSGWKPKKTYTYLTNRTQSRVNQNTNVRVDGVFEDFEPFWLYTAGKGWVPSTNKKWSWVEEVTIFSPRSQEFERKNSLGIYSASVFGYSGMLPIGVAANAQYKEIGFDNFEDAYFDDCKNDHFSYKKFRDQNSEKKAHTGRKSLYIPPNDRVSVTKLLEACEPATDNNK